MVVKLVDCDYNILAFVCDLLLDVPSLEIGTKLDDGIGNELVLRVDGSCRRSLSVGGVSG
jgi:hypothetical protein